METINDYQKQALDFLAKTKCEIEIKFLKNGKHFDDDKDFRDIYEITLKRGNRKYAFNFGQSIAQSLKYIDKQSKWKFTSNGGSLKGNRVVNDLSYLKNYCIPVKGTKPTEYDILTCLTKYNPYTFQDFCGEFGYDTDSKKAEKTYRAVVDEWLNISALFSEDELKLLREIQ